MPRRPRIQLDGVPLHIVQRGHNLQACFVAEADCQAYLLARMRYIELNPVRAGMCPDPAQYRWSSYRANALGEPTAVLMPHPLYESLAGDTTRRQTAYRKHFDQVLTDKTLSDIRQALNQTQPLGNSRFVDAIEQATSQRRETKPRGRPRKSVEESVAGGDSGQLDLAGL